MLVCLCFATTSWASVHRLGGGINYWTTIDSLDEGFDRNGVSYLVSYQYRPWVVGLEFDLELLPDRFGETAIAPQAYVLLGDGLYAAAGIGLVHTDGSFADKPFFALRAGINLNLLPGLFVDISANYRFNDTTELKDQDKKIDTDTIFLGAALRFAL
ncbi:hypothetical protein JWG43_01725 [Desulfobulbus alkaliphilus]|nr:hypothetical protein [Desulfobulbus alkaliphilus]